MKAKNEAGTGQKRQRGRLTKIIDGIIITVISTLIVAAIPLPFLKNNQGANINIIQFFIIFFTDSDSTTPQTITSSAICPLPFVDNFESDLSPCWRLYQGEWERIQEQNNNYAYSGDGNWSIVLLGYSDWENYSVQFKVKPISITEENAAGNFALHFRVTDISRDYYGINLYYHRGNIALGRTTNNVWSRLDEQSIPLSVNDWNEIQVDVVENRILIVVNGVQTFDVIDDTFSRGFVGFQAILGSTNLIDDVHIERR